MDKLRQIIKEAIVWDDDQLNELVDITAKAILKLFKERVTVESMEYFLEKNWNHLFSPEENYLGRLNFARALVAELRKKEGER
jgi:hypothetical protein